MRSLREPVSALAFALVGFALLWAPSHSVEPLLVADLRGQALVVLDPAHPDSARRIALPGGPHELLRLPDGRVLVSLEQSGVLAVVEVESGVVETIEVGGVPHGLGLHEGVVFVTDRSVNLVRRFALDGWRELPSVVTGEWPHAVAVTPSGGLAVASAGPGAVYLDGVEVLVGETTETVAVRADGLLAAAAATEGVVVLLSPEGDLLARWEVSGRPVRVAFSPDGNTLAVALSAGQAVALITDDRVRHIPVQGVPDGLAFSSDGRVVYVSDVFGGAVTAVDTRSGEVRAVLRGGESTGAILVSVR
jgi:DNA-binding beta-propeller fold protein YncE